MTRLLLRILLLAVLFNTAIGLPAHEAKHFPNVGEVVAGWHVDVDGDAGEVPEDGLHELCEWCHAFAQAFAPAGAGAAALPWATARDRFVPAVSAPHVRSARPWTFASRDPPSA